jgi:Flp pilus assembly protein TadD
MRDTEKEFFDDLGDFDLRTLAQEEMEYRVPVEVIVGLARGTITHREALGVTSESIRKVTEYGFALLEQGYATHAAIVFDGLLTLDPNVAYFHLGLGAALKNAGQPEAAMQEWEIARRLDPEDITAYINQAQVLIDQQRMDDARALLERARELDPHERHMMSSQLKRMWIAHFVPA